MRARIIPALQIKERKLVKTRQFGRARYVGDPINAIRVFNEKEVDELILLDIGNKGRIDFEYIEKCAEECFMPLTYGGGIRRHEDASALFRLGIEKVVLREAAYADPGFVKELVKRFGSQSISVSVDTGYSRLGFYYIYPKRRLAWGTKKLHELVVSMEMCGVGEIILTMVGQEGMKAGPDLRLLQDLRGMVDIPLIYSGGIRGINDIKKVLRAGADGVACGSQFIFHKQSDSVLISYIDNAIIEDLSVLI